MCERHGNSAIALAAHLLGLGMGVATIVSLVPAVTRLMHALN